jgi:hypothetical protein
VFLIQDAPIEEMTTLFGVQGTRPNLKRKFFHSKILITKIRKKYFLKSSKIIWAILRKIPNKNININSVSAQSITRS